MRHAARPRVEKADAAPSRRTSIAPRGWLGTSCERTTARRAAQAVMYEEMHAQREAAKEVKSTPYSFGTFE